MEPMVFIKTTHRSRDRDAFMKIMKELQKSLPRNTQVCCCLGRKHKKIHAHLQFFIGKREIPFHIVGSSINAVNLYISSYILPEVSCWEESYEDFFEMASSTFEGCAGLCSKNCNQKSCFVFEQLKRVSQRKAAKLVA